MIGAEFLGSNESSGIANARSEALSISSGDLTFRLVQRADGPSKGIVLSMAGLDGRAVGGTYAKAGIFADHDLWACAVRIDMGKAFNPRVWPALAQQIADHIQRGKSPQPNVLVGYSMGGYIAWLVGRLLAQSPCQVDHVIALDTPPMHVRKRDRSPELAAFLEMLPSLPLPMLDIRRAAPLPLMPAEPNFCAWQEQDGPMVTVTVATLDHDDMIKPHLLHQIAPAVQSYIAGGAAAIPQGWLFEPVASFSGEVFSMLQSQSVPCPARLTDLLHQADRQKGQISLAGLLFLALVHAGPDEVAHLSARLQRQYPRSIAFNYARNAVRCFGRYKAAVQPVPRLTPDRVPLPSWRAYDLAVRQRWGGSPRVAIFSIAILMLAIAQSSVGLFVDHKRLFNNIVAVTERIKRKIFNVT